MNDKIDYGARLRELFVNLLQRQRAELSKQARRATFLKFHGMARGEFVVGDVPECFRVGLFAEAGTHEAFVRFSSDEPVAMPDRKSTLGLGIKVLGQDRLGLQDFVLQNHDVFAVDDAKAMYELMVASVVNGEPERYLAEHPETARIYKAMQRVETSVLMATFWSATPYRCGPGQVVKYKLLPHTPWTPGPVDDPDYLEIDLAARLQEGEARFSLQLQSKPPGVDVDRATQRWSEEESPPQTVAELILPRQEIYVPGQCELGENLTFHPWSCLPEHEPVGSINEARRIVYPASAAFRHDFNGIPETDRPPAQSEAERDEVATAAIHPTIGIARVGDSEDEWYIGPEVPEPAPLPPGAYRDRHGALKRQAARFRIFGYNAAGVPVREFTLDDDEIEIEWEVHLANHKSAWYQFQLALDIPEAEAAPASNLRNAHVADRRELVIDPGERRIRGADSGPAGAVFDTGQFMGKRVYLGELRTDPDGRLIVLGGHGRSASCEDARAFTFANNDTWHDDISDGPVRARVKWRGRTLVVKPAWVVVAPPAYGVAQKSVRTMWDLARDVAVQAGVLARARRPSFQRDIRPIFQRLSRMQWVNAGFAAAFGWKSPFSLSDPKRLQMLSDSSMTVAATRRNIYNQFRQFDRDAWAPQGWPWLYGDAMNVPAAHTPRQFVQLTSLQLSLLEQWASGDFEADFDPDCEPGELDACEIKDQPKTLDRASLEFCIADAFHPGCEMTWPMRHASMYSEPFRIKHAKPGEARFHYGQALDRGVLALPDGPLAGQVAGGLTRWMAVPWQTDTASCRSGYDKEYDPYLPTFWPARAPNQVLTEANYRIVMDLDAPLETRRAAFNTRSSWLRPLGGKSIMHQLNNMIERFPELGVIEPREGPGDDHFPREIEVETLGEHPLEDEDHQAEWVDVSDFDKLKRFPRGLPGDD